MRVGVPKETKAREHRVGLVPASVRELVQRGHAVWVQASAGAGIGASDADYEAAGARIVAEAEGLWREAELVVKVKEPQPVERAWLSSGQLLFCYLHLAPDVPQTDDLLRSGVSAIAYETVTQPQGGLPLLAPMSEVAGRLSVQAGAHCLLAHQGGRGVLLGGVPGVASASVVVLGGGMVGTHAAAMALGLGARVTVLDRSVDALRRLWMQFGPALQTVYATQEAVEQACMQADLVIGSVLIPGAAAPKLITRDLVRRMRPGAVIVDVAIDQGGCSETSQPTTHDAPTYVEEGVVHYAVTNMPGAVPHTSTHALNHATLPYVLRLADQGLAALREDAHFRAGLNVHAGQVTHAAVARAQGRVHTEALDALA
jgi:alanine dehydrogenase